MDYDVIIVGGGPAGLSTAVQLRRDGYSAMILAKDHLGRRFDLLSPDAKGELALFGVECVCGESAAD